MQAIDDSLILIPSGTYQMGSPESERQRGTDETQHEVSISAFYVDPYEVKQKDYQEVMIYLNLADDYFKTLQEAMMLRAQKDEMEKEIYSLKHELIGLQMKQESAEKKAE